VQTVRAAFVASKNFMIPVNPPSRHDLRRSRDGGDVDIRASANSREDRGNGETTMHVYILIQIATRKQAFFCRHV
jgi:hypothetical protein